MTDLQQAPAVDVDKPADLDLANRLIAERG